MYIPKICVLFLIQIASQFVEVQTKKGDSCDNGSGKCEGISTCAPVFANLNTPEFTIPFCDDNILVCCPNPIPSIAIRFGDTAPLDAQSSVHLRQCADFKKLISKCDPLPLIVNGIKAVPREFPHMAWVGTKIDGVLKQLCGGTLISENFILTAAHCIYGAETELNHVRLGELDYSHPDSHTQEFGIKKLIDHPEYDAYSRYNDIALLQLDRPATLNEYVMPACLPVVNGTEFPNFIATGWGLTGNAKNASTHLLRVNLERYTDEECDLKVSIEDDVSRLYKGVHARTQICAGSKLDKSDTCQGDSGGPLFVQHSNYQCMFTVIGITSYGFGCGNRNVPGVYTRVNLYTDWIERIVWRAAGWA